MALAQVDFGTGFHLVAGTIDTLEELEMVSRALEKKIIGGARPGDRPIHPETIYVALSPETRAVVGITFGTYIRIDVPTKDYYNIVFGGTGSERTTETTA